ncbi:regulatory protein RecX [Sphingomonas sp. DT-207]|uniref:regulatory protein RecX n=1 Tax=Sphingomonas sp. DT-207 TaxID=3396167 RepID=UPI003F1AA3D1
MVPLEAADLERLALRYVERYATTRGRLATYLASKIRERGWSGESAPDLTALAERMAELGYVDDRGFADAKANAMARRGLGARRVAEALRHAGVESADAAALAPDIEARAATSALAFARRKRIGPFGAEVPDKAQREKQLAAMLRAGHSFDLARRIVRMAPGEDVDMLAVSQWD